MVLPERTRGHAQCRSSEQPEMPDPHFCQNDTPQTLSLGRSVRKLRRHCHIMYPNCFVGRIFIQWRLSNKNTLGAKESVLISEVS